MHDQTPTFPEPSNAVPNGFSGLPAVEPGPSFFGPLSKPRLRFFWDGEQGAAGGGDGSTGNVDGSGPTGNDGDEAPLSAADAKALRAQADKRMQERNAARDEAKAFRDIGLTVEEIAELKAARDKAQGGPTPEQIAEQARKDADAAANERIAARARTSAVREQAAALGFHEPKDALALLDRAALDEIAVDDDDEADPKAVRTLLEKLAAARPYLVKKPGFASARDAGIGSTGSATRPDPGPGQARLAAAYADASASR